MAKILLILLIWFVLSIPVAVLVGRRLGRVSGRYGPPPVK